MSPSALALSLALLAAAPAAAYVAPAPVRSSSSSGVGAMAQTRVLEAAVPEGETAAAEGPLGLLAASAAVGAALGWLSARRQQAASA
eukprot:CAMPEP_0204513176 /NCGR_PEP_ID=MMETSP0661-20131031/1361_1 /ASSEMBLY_ACC=CAM_ASM_000606 /TAXON_ID=109239 /ORGANISM="Alexandrium margalefi, Strain AMGDE01CS-322" /LENGTH=86 /DNA_ID=CAMNT_0051518329 /DNA_START=49 /DNA_END=306 /DNA_ORIENTATION=-